ncbi:MAG TPA: tetratricopeptide repeat protein [Myxococcales bacterium]|nr:tetratricopeptide repeat protein [Myxococcales bacterium]
MNTINTKLRQPAVIGIMMGLVAILVHLPVIQNDFVYDDFPAVVENPLVNGELENADWTDAFTGHYWGNRPGFENLNMWRPLTTLSFYLNAQLFGMEPASFHAVNLLLHGLVTALVVLLFQVWFGRVAVSAIAGGLFAVMPVHVEVIAAVANRTELIAAVFYIGGLAAWIRARSGEHSGRYFGVALACLALGLLAKEHVVTWPCAVLVYELYRRFDDKELNYSAPPMQILGAMAGIIVLYFWARASVFTSAFDWQVPAADNPLVEHGFSARILTSGSIIFNYLQMLIAPVQLSADYSANAIPIVTSWSDGNALAGLFFLSLTVLTMVSAALTHRSIAACTALFLGLLVFVSNLLFLIPIIMAERLMYLPSFAWCGLMGLIVAEIFAAPQRSRVFFVIGCVVMFSGYATRSFSRTMDWHDELTLFEKTVKAVPTSARAQYNYGWALLKKGDLDAAERHLKKSNAIVPGDADVLNAMGTIRWNRKDAKGALAFYERSFSARPNAAAVANLCRAFVANGQNQRAVKSCRIASARYPRNAMVHHFWGLALAQIGDLEKALKVLERARSIEPQHPGILKDFQRIKRQAARAGTVPKVKNK